jgi:hypothetical protein
MTPSQPPKARVIVVFATSLRQVAKKMETTRVEGMKLFNKILIRIVLLLALVFVVDAAAARFFYV